MRIRSCPALALISSVLFVAVVGFVGCSKGKHAAPFPRTAEVSLSAVPSGVVVGDVNGDGTLDLVTPHGSAKTISVLLGDGHGNFAAAPGTPFSVAAQPDLLDMIDVDLDGDLDLFATGHDHSGVIVLLGDGKGSFAAAPGSPFPAHADDVHPHNHALNTGDVSGDGKPDAITGNDGNGTISVLLGDGTGKLALAGAPMAIGDQPYLSVLADVDGDSLLDLVAPLVGDDALAVLRGDGRGGFTHVAGSPFKTIVRPYAVAVADLDGDGRQDILIAHDDTDKMTILMGAEGGAFEPAEGSPFSTGDRIWRMAIADVDGDGSLDVAAGAGERVLLFLGQRGRGFKDAVRVELEAEAWSVASGDFDRDGKADLVAPNGSSSSLKLWLSTET